MSIEEIIRTEMRNALNPVLQQNGEMRKEIQELKSILAKNEDKLLTIQQAADLLQVDRNTFLRYRAKGLVKRGGGTVERPRFWQSDVLKLKKEEF